MKRYKHFLIGAIIFLVIGFYTPFLFAGTTTYNLGYQYSINWSGNGALIKTPSNSQVSDFNPDTNSVVEVSYEDEYMDAWAESSAYVLKGSVYNSNNTEGQAGGYF